MNEQVIKILARMTPIGRPWPIGAWVYVESWTDKAPGERFFQVKEGMFNGEDSESTPYRRESDEISEAEANAQGIHRDETRLNHVQACEAFAQHIQKN